jgi:hypothetical protein
MRALINDLQTADKIPGLEHMYVGRTRAAAVFMERPADYRDVNSLVNGGFLGPSRPVRPPRLPACAPIEEKMAGSKGLILADPLV